MRKYWHEISMIFFAATVSCIYFAPFSDNFFVYDTFMYIGNLFAGPLKVMFGYNAFRVVSNFMWYPLYFLSGFDPAGYGFFNGLLFALNAFLLYLLTLQLWGKKELSLLIAALFVLNGTACDAVFWHMAMSTLLCASLYLLTLNAYVSYRKGGNGNIWLLTLFLYTITMFTKEDAASFPFVIVLIDVLFFDGLSDIKSLIKRVTPFCLVIAGYLLTSNVVFHIFGIKSETAKFFKIRPLHSLFSGYSAFFLAPNGVLSLSSPYIYITALAIITSFFVVKNRKLLLFGYAWILVTFLPQSLGAIGQFQPKYIFNSISRLLYLPVIGVSIVIAVLLLQLGSKLPPKAAWSVISIFLVLFFCLNFSRVRDRGVEWRNEAEPVRIFLRELMKIMPEFPENSYVTVEYAPTGRAYIQQSLRAFYKNPKITWVDDPYEFVPKPGDSQFLIINYGETRPDNPIKIYKR